MKRKPATARMILGIIRDLDKEISTGHIKRRKLLARKCDLVIRYIEELRKKVLEN